MYVHLTNVSVQKHGVSIQVAPIENEEKRMYEKLVFVVGRIQQ